MTNIEALKGQRLATWVIGKNDKSKSFCNRCGHQVNTYWKYCNNCGAKCEYIENINGELERVDVRE